MLIFDQLKKDDLQLRLVAVLVLGGLSVLLAGLLRSILSLGED